MPEAKYTLNTHAGQHQEEKPSTTAGETMKDMKEAHMFERRKEREAVLKHLKEQHKLCSKQPLQYKVNWK